ncbi:flavin reductase family protein [Streptomyces sp. Je 1-332]|uniref:flavin reductase family protein n=1 Tax=Streptomyces sp. Je 1-332 TaxID=3231270 RepID=UPI00345ACCF9
MTSVSAAYEPAVSRTGSPVAGAPASLRNVMSQFATGVVVLTVGGGRPHAMTANAFSSVSLATPSVLCSVAHSAVMHDVLEGGGKFGVSVLSAEQEYLARHFANKERELGAAQFEGVDCFAGLHTDAPLLRGALAWMECELEAAHSSGDHTIFIGSVLESRVGDGHQGLLFFDGKFGRASRVA